MASYQPVAFNSPGFDYGADISQIERRRQMAQMLQQSGLQQEQQAPVAPGQFAVPYSPLQGASKMAQILAASRQQKKADEQQQALGIRSRKDLADVLTRAQTASTGTPDKTIMPDPQEAIQSADYGTPEVGAVNVAGQKPNPMAAANIYMSHPQTAQLGMQMAGQEQQQQMMAQAIKNAMAGAQPQGAPNAAAGGTTPPAYGSPNFQPGASPQPQQQAPQGTPSGVDPMAWNLAIAKGDLGALAKMRQDAFVEANKPVVNRGFGLGRMVGGQYVPDEASLQQALAMKRGEQGITGPQAHPITLKTSEGREIQVSPPEWAEIQRSGQLPARLGGQQQSSPNALQQPPQAGGITVPGAPGLGTIGVTQPQSAQVQQAAQLASNTEASREFISEMRQNYAKLRDVPATINNINRAKELAAGEAAQFMGPFGESKLALQKFFRSNVPGMGNLNLEGVTKAEELQSSLFNQVMDNLKKMDASPSQYQQQVMQEAFGTLRTDPASLPRIMDVFEDILRNRVALHNETVGSAEKRGTQFPYDVNVKLPGKKGQPLTAAEQQELVRLRQQVGR